MTIVKKKLTFAHSSVIFFDVYTEKGWKWGDRRGSWNPDAGIKVEGLLSVGDPIVDWGSLK